MPLPDDWCMGARGSPHVLLHRTHRMMTDLTLILANPLPGNADPLRERTVRREIRDVEVLDE